MFEPIILSRSNTVINETGVWVNRRLVTNMIVRSEVIRTWEYGLMVMIARKYSVLGYRIDVVDAYYKHIYDLGIIADRIPDEIYMTNEGIVLRHGLLFEGYNLTDSVHTAIKRGEVRLTPSGYFALMKSMRDAVNN